jgi:hypothetical protein
LPSSLVRCSLPCSRLPAQTQPVESVQANLYLSPEFSPSLLSSAGFPPAILRLGISPGPKILCHFNLEALFERGGLSELRLDRRMHMRRPHTRKIPSEYVSYCGQLSTNSTSRSRVLTQQSSRMTELATCPAVTHNLALCFHLMAKPKILWARSYKVMQYGHPMISRLISSSMVFANFPNTQSLLIFRSPTD